MTHITEMLEESSVSSNGTDEPLVANRRRRLAKFFEGTSMPAREKSFLSQLINGKASFGEKAARRIENTYGMGSGYLDVDDDGKPIEGGGGRLVLRPGEADVVFSIVSGALNLAGLPEDFFGSKEVVKESLMQGQRLDAYTLGEIKRAMIELWQQEAESIGILAEHPDDGREGLERARKRIGADVAGMLFDKLKERADRPRK